MPDQVDFNQIVEIMMNEDDESLGQQLLMESEKDTVLVALNNDATLMNYYMLFEEFLERHDIYLFDGWDRVQFVNPPEVEKFWLRFTLALDEKVDVRGVRRIKDAVRQGEVKVKKMDDAKGHIVTVLILKRALDKIETENQEKIDKLSERALDELQN